MRIFYAQKAQAALKLDSVLALSRPAFHNAQRKKKEKKRNMSLVSVAYVLYLFSLLLRIHPHTIKLRRVLWKHVIRLKRREDVRKNVLGTWSFTKFLSVSHYFWETFDFFQPIPRKRFRYVCSFGNEFQKPGSIVLSKNIQHPRQSLGLSGPATPYFIKSSIESINLSSKVARMMKGFLPIFVGSFRG